MRSGLVIRALNHAAANGKTRLELSCEPRPAHPVRCNAPAGGVAINEFRPTGWTMNYGTARAGRPLPLAALLLLAVSFAHAGDARAATASGAPGLTPLPKVATPRLYVLDCGTLVNNKPEDYGLKREEVKDTNMAVTCYLVVHPKGMLIFDTGLNDWLVGRPLYENVVEGYGQIKFNTLRGQLADIGVTPATIDYLVTSHYHWDHVGNAGDFAGSTWLVYKGDRDQMFGKEARTYAWFNQYAALEHSKTTIVSGDHDVFGDGTVVVIATPGHTEGHCSLLVRLKNTGPVVLSGDLYHYQEERDLKRMPAEERSTGTVESRQKVEELLRRTGAQLWVGHSMEFFRTVRKSPAWYD